MREILFAILLGSLIGFLAASLFSCTKETETPEPEPAPYRLVTMVVDINDFPAGQIIYIDCMGEMYTISKDWTKDVTVNDGEIAELEIFSEFRFSASAFMTVADRIVASCESDDLNENPIKLIYSW